MIQMHESFGLFNRLVSPWLSGYDKVLVSAVGVKDEGKRFILAARIDLLSPLSTSFGRAALDDEVFWGQTEEVAFCPSNFPKLMENLSVGSIRVGSVEGELPKDSQPRSYPSFYPGHTPRADHPGPRVPLLRVVGGSSGILLYRVVNSQEVEWHLQSLRPPFANLNDLYEHLCLPRNDTGDLTVIELSAVPPIEFGRESGIKDGCLQVSINAAEGLDLDLISVGYTVKTSSGVERGNIDRERFRWVKNDKRVAGMAHISLGGHPEADCFLTYADRGLQRIRLVEQKRLLNVRAAIQRAFDPDLRQLRQLLFEFKRDDAKRFEDGVAILFGMLGFTITQNGRAKKLSESPDIIATTGAGHVAVVECTTDLPDKGDQFATVLKRAVQTRQALQHTGWPNIEVLPVVVTLLKESAIPGQKDDAEAKGLLLLCADDLQQALDLVAFPMDADHLFERWVARLGTPNFMKVAIFG